MISCVSLSTLEAVSVLYVVLFFPGWNWSYFYKSSCCRRTKFYLFLLDIDIRRTSDTMLVILIYLDCAQDAHTWLRLAISEEAILFASYFHFDGIADSFQPAAGEACGLSKSSWAKLFISRAVLAVPPKALCINRLPKRMWQCLLRPVRRYC